MKRTWGVMMLTVVACSGESDRQDMGPDDDEPEAKLDARVADASSDAGMRGPMDARSDEPRDGSTTDASTPSEDASICAMRTPNIDVTAVRVTKAAVKGDGLELELTLRNSGGGAMVDITPTLTSMRFSDYTDVPLATQQARVCPGESTVKISGGPFLSKGKKQYALGSGKYTVSGVKLDDATDTKFDGASFEVATSNAILVPVVYDQGYLDGITKNPYKTPEAYLESVFSRPNEIFTPSGNDPDGAGTYKSFPNGFDEMMKVKHHFKSFPGYPGDSFTSDGSCEDATAYATQVLGLAAAWNGSGTRPDRHGFDYLIALDPKFGGGVTCGWIDVQVSGFINRDLDRQQVICIHESGHVFGAPHCDDVGNGSGGSLQGYVMCSGEKHEHYPEQFVWHSTSITAMKPHWN